MPVALSCPEGVREGAMGQMDLGRAPRGGSDWLITRPYTRWATRWRSFLGNSFPPELKTQFPSVKFQLVSSSQIAEEDTTNLDQKVTIFLHRITINENFRSATHIQNQPNKTPVLFLDLHYLITYWGTDPQAEQTILGWTMSQLQSGAHPRQFDSLSEQHLGPDGKHSTGAGGSEPGRHPENMGRPGPEIPFERVLHRPRSAHRYRHHA